MKPFPATAPQEKSHVRNWTLAELDEHEDITVAVLGIVSDFYTNNRPDTAEISMNKMSKSLLDMHSKNLL